MFGFGGNNKKGNSIQDKIKKVKRIRMIIMALGAAMPVIGNVLLGLLVACIVIFPIMYIGEKIEAFFAGVGEFVVTTSEKMLNLVTGNGWFTNEDSYFIALKNEYQRFNEYPYSEGEFDVAILAATAHYSKMIDTTIYTPDNKCSKDNPDYDESKCNKELNSQGPAAVEEDETRDFYKVALDNIGSAYTLWPGEKKLVGHLIGTRFNTLCTKAPSGLNIFNPSAWGDLVDTAGDLLHSIVLELENSFTDTTKDAVGTINLLNLASSIWSYAKEENAGYIESQLSNVKYEAVQDSFIANIKYIIDNSVLNFDCSYMGEAPEGYQWVAIPMLVKYLDYDRYIEYLKNVYIPLRFKDRLLKVEDASTEYYNLLNFQFYDALSQRQKTEVDNIVDSIFGMRDSYLYLLGDARNSTIRIRGMTSLPVQIGSGEDWQDYVTRGYQLGTAKCFVNGEWTGESNCNHLGIDFSWGGCENTPVSAIATGVVQTAVSDISGNPTAGYGKHVVIAHDINEDGKFEYYSLYGHLNRVDVEVGDKVSAGEQIGLLGSTGNSTGAHLHFEIWDEEKRKIDPAPVLNGIAQGGVNPLAGAMTCNMYTAEQLAAKETTLKSKVAAAGYGTRAGVVAAAKYLSSDMGVIIPYFYGGKYWYEGISENWGCARKIGSSGTDKQPSGSTWPDGLDCSGFVAWSITNGGYKASYFIENAQGSTNQGNMTDDKVDASDPSVISKVKAGDLMWNSEHIAIIIGVDVSNCKYYVAEAKGADYGVVVTPTACNSNRFEKIVLMDDFYNNADRKTEVTK